MNTHEYQAKKIFQQYGLPTPDFHVIDSLGQLENVLEQTGWTEAVIKIQVHAGGRGKAGGVKVARGREQIILSAKELLGMKIVNQQTGPEGMTARQLLISPIVEIVKEYYLAIVIDRNGRCESLIASPVGGMDIEEVAHSSPDQVLVFPLPLLGQLKNFQLLEICKFMGWTGGLAKEGAEIIKKIVRIFRETDAQLLEINPLVLSKEAHLLALDAKLSIDENALYRQPELKAVFDVSQLSKQEAKAYEHELAYIPLEGDIGCMVNGAGLAMATMDIIHHFGGAPANFLDVGGSASKEKVAEGFKIILQDPKVKAILINIFGGIMNCDTLAAGVVEAAKELAIDVPLVVRIEGTNVEKGRERLKNAQLSHVISATDLNDAAKKVIEAGRGG